MLTRSTILVSMIVLGAAACGDHDDNRGPRWTASDSSGVRITHSPRPQWRPADRPVVDTEPSVLVGAHDGPDGLHFGMISSGVLLDGNQAAVLDRQSMEIIVLDSLGQLVARIGRHGEGPGEFNSVWQVHALSDTLVAFDHRARRITRFTSDGTPVDAIAITAPEYQLSRYELIGRAAGRWLLQGSIYFPGGCGPQAMCWDTLPTLSVDSEDSVSLSTIEPAGVGMFASLQGAGGHPFGGRTRSAMRGQSPILGDGRTPEVRAYGANGEPSAIGRWDAEPRPARARDLEAFVDAAVERARVQGSPTNLVEARYDGIDLPDHMPLFDQLIVDPRGWVWLEPWAPAHEPDPTSWTVLGPDLEWLGEVQMPPGVRVLAIGADRVLGVWRDEFDVQMVGTWRLAL